MLGMALQDFPFMVFAENALQNRYSSDIVYPVVTMWIATGSTYRIKGERS